MQHDRSMWLRRLTALWALLALFLTQAPHAQAQSLTQDAAECFLDAWDEYIECIDDLPWWAELLCAARFTSDMVLCAPKIVMDQVKK